MPPSLALPVDDIPQMKRFTDCVISKRSALVQQTKHKKEENRGTRLFRKRVSNLENDLLLVVRIDLRMNGSDELDGQADESSTGRSGVVLRSRKKTVE